MNLSHLTLPSPQASCQLSHYGMSIRSFDDLEGFPEIMTTELEVPNGRAQVDTPKVDASRTFTGQFRDGATGRRSIALPRPKHGGIPTRITSSRGEDQSNYMTPTNSSKLHSKASNLSKNESSSESAIPSTGRGKRWITKAGQRLGVTTQLSSIPLVSPSTEKSLGISHSSVGHEISPQEI